MKCPRCHTANRRGARFCRSCNATLGVACSACGQVSVLGSHYCDVCGAQLPALRAEAAPRPTLPRPHDYPPIHLAEKIRSLRRLLEGERKQVTALFCDIVNSTSLMETLGPETTHVLLDRFFDRVVPEVHRFEGTVNQFLGDGFMALYGAPVAHEDHARRAVLSALAIRRALAEGIAVPGISKVDLAVRQGINTGFVVIGKIGENLRMDYTAVGDTTNVAARLQQVAASGDILIGEPTQRAVASMVQFDAIGPLQLKGKAHPVAAYRVLGLRLRRSGGETVTRRPLSPFVGRDREIAMLHDALSEVESSRGRIVGLVGEPGMGKSRVLHEFSRSVAPQRAFYLEGRCPSYGAAMAYTLALDLLSSNCGIVDGDTADEMTEKVNSALREVGLDPVADAPPLLRLLGVRSEPEQSAATSPEGFKTRVLDILCNMVLRGSRLRPVFLGLEDLHWLDPTSAEFLALLAERLAGASVLIVATYRPGYTPPWSGKSYASQIALRPLSTTEGSSIVVTLLLGAAMLATTIVAKAEGNPFFLEELARNATEHAGDKLASAVPNTIHDVITARIDRLSASAKRALLAAAVLGREFASNILEQTLEGAIPFGPALEELIHSEFLYERHGTGSTTYVFRHALTQDVAYGMLLQERKVRYHAAAGVAIMLGNVDRLDTVAELLAHHFGLSDRNDDAVRFGLQAAENARRRWANEEAFGYFKSVVSRLDAMPDTRSNRLLRIDAVIGEAEVMFALGRQSEHVQALEAIRPLVMDCGDDRRRAAWSYWTGFLHSFTGSRPEVSIAYCRDAARIASDAGLEDLQAYANCCLAHVSVLAGDLTDAMAAGERALPVFEALGNIHWACRTLWGMSMAANALGEWSRGLEICKRALDYGSAANDSRLTVVGWMRTGSTLIFQGHPTEGIVCCDRALGMSPSPYDARMIRSIRAFGRLRSGEQLDEAVSELREATEWFEQSKLRYTWTYFSLWLTEGYLRQGRADLALALAERALSVAEALGYRHLDGLARRLIGESLIETDLARAAQYLDEAGVVLASVHAQNDLAKTFVQQARLQKAGARPLLSDALRLFDALGTADETERARALLARLPVD
jgi:class 3 adenylate cyclase/tetratricopeptide (TPR) repeat protein